MRHAIAALAVLAISTPAAAALTPVTSFGSNPGTLDMYEYVPAGLPAGSPLVVVLHGCTQSAAAMVSAGWNTLADQYKFAVLYPEQTSTNNPVECFNWAGNYGNLADLQRGMGENQSIMSMIDYEIAHHAVDTHKVFIAGFSAGAAFTSVMLATWPDRFAAGAIMEGVAYMCATSVAGAYSCQSPGVTKTAVQWGDLVRSASSNTGPWPRVQIWEGTSDTTVVPANQAELVKQWTNVQGADQTPDETETIGAAARAAYKVGTTTVVETYTITGMTHAVSVGAEGATVCPATAGQYFEAHAICATLREATFFGLTGSGSGSGSGSASGDPDVSIVSPSDGDTVTGQVTIVVAASDTVGIATVDLAIDGSAAGTSSTAPYQFAWDATAAGPGSHVLVATAHDANGHDGSATATVTVPGAGGSGSNAGSNAETGTGDLPGCSLDASGGRSLAPLAVVLVLLVSRRRRA